MTLADDVVELVGSGELAPQVLDRGEQVLDAVWFIASMQVTDDQDPEYGGIREGEELQEIVQTDNTSESIWMGRI